MRAVNLLPIDSGKSTRKTPKPVAITGLVGTGVVLVALGAGFFMSNGTLSQKETELANVQTELLATPRPEPPKPAVEASPLAGQRAPRLNALSTALADRVSWDRIFRRFSLVLPDDIWLQTLAATAPVEAEAGAAAPEGSAGTPGFAITGRTYSHDGVARLLKRLQALPDLENVQLSSSKLADVGGQDVVEFTIVAGVRPDGASS
jgi:Tfp pilus assembly protein PilN